MKSSRAARGHARVLGAIVSTGLLLCTISPALMAQTPSPSAQPQSLEAWHASMSRTPLPRKGCFEASYPSTEWQEVPCTALPSYPLPQSRGRKAHPNTVGYTYGDFVAQVASGFISTAEGSFASVTPGITETGTDPHTGKTNHNAFTLQLNSNTFTNQVTTSLCSSGATHTSCIGWQQFAFENDGNGPAAPIAFIQYWLENYGTAASMCPAGWKPYSPSPNVIDCYRSTAGMGNIPIQTMADLAQLRLTGTAGSGGMDTLTLLTTGSHLSAMGLDSVLGLAQGWQTAEFNIFGDGYSTEANFSSGTTIVVKITVDSGNGTTDAPTYVNESFTGETDNLTLVPPPCLYGGASPAMEFMETNAASPTATCFISGLQAFTTLASLNGTNGAYPDAGLVQTASGDLYGITAGLAGYGTIFKITPSGALTALYNFCSQVGCTDGTNPMAGLVQAANGDL
jgi:uncharacterized repeat protein (TIGR03803 family)